MPGQFMARFSAKKGAPSATSSLNEANTSPSTQVNDASASAANASGGIGGSQAVNIGLKSSMAATSLMLLIFVDILTSYLL